MKMKYKKVKDVNFLIKSSKKINKEDQYKEEFALDIPLELLLKKEQNKKGNK